MIFYSNNIYFEKNGEKRVFSYFFSYENANNA